MRGVLGRLLQPTGAILLLSLYALFPSRAAAEHVTRTAWVWSYSPRPSTLPIQRARNAVSKRLSRAEAADLMERCAPTTPRSVLLSVAEVESGLDPLTLRDNTTSKSYHPRSLEEAILLGTQLLQANHSIDAGLLQINSYNFRKLGLNLKNALEPCANITAAGVVINANYANAVRLKSSMPILQTAYSFYNTGRAVRGFKNGYADKIVEATQRTVRFAETSFTTVQR